MTRQGDNKCAACGQWAGPGHRCPTPASTPDMTNRPEIVTERDTLSDQVAARVAAAQAVLTQIPSTRRDFSPLGKDAGTVIATDMGETERDFDTVASQALKDTAHTLHGDTMLPPDVAADALNALLPPGQDTDDLVDRARRGVNILTRHEIEALGRVSTLLLERQAQQATPMIPETVTEWISSTEDRRCTACGQFIGIRTSHTCPPDTTVGRALYNAIRTSYVRMERRPTGNGYGRTVKWARTFHTLNADLFENGEEAETVALRPLQNVTEDEQQDFYYHEGKMLVPDEHLIIPPSLVVFTHLNKNRNATNGTGYTLDVPASLRRAFVENPTPLSSNEAAFLAATIEPPLEDYEIAHMIEAGNLNTLRGLLNAKRTRTQTLQAVLSTSSPAATAALTTRELPAQIAENMATSPNPRIRLQSIHHPDLSLTALETLAADPDDRVRMQLLHPTGQGLDRDGYDSEPENAWKHRAVDSSRAILNQTAGRGNGYYHQKAAIERYPRLATTLFNDPNPDIAMSALKQLGRNEASVYAVAQITDSQRFTDMRAAFCDANGFFDYYDRPVNFDNSLLAHIETVGNLPGPPGTQPYEWKWQPRSARERYEG